MDLNNKRAWCEEYGDKVERSFCVDRLYDLGLTGFMNLEKKKNVYAHDMFSVFPSDLKTVRTPFFKAWEKFQIDPQYAVTINMKDMQRYKDLYPNIVVVFDVLWDDKICKKFIEGVEYGVKPMHKTYAGFIQDIRAAVSISSPPGRPTGAPWSASPMVSTRAGPSRGWSWPRSARTP